MVELELEEAGTRLNGQTPVVARVPAPATSRPPAPAGGEADVLRRFLDEIDSYHQAIKGFADSEPDVVLLQCSSFLARLSEMRGECWRRSGARFAQIRSREIEPLIHDLHYQFQIHSRLLTVRELDYKMSRGQ